MRQRTPEWDLARLCTPTSSRFNELITPLGKPRRGESVTTYRRQLIGEWLTGLPHSIPTTRAMQHGIENEDAARDVYEHVTGNEVEQVGFIRCDSLPCGCSPDGLIGDVGGIEIKCPFNTGEHVRTILDGDVPPQYVAQVQGSLLVTGRKWWDLVSYDPRIDDVSVAMFILRVYRDEEFIGTLRDAIVAFDLKLQSEIRTIQKRRKP
jgi:hypothetical protein